MKTYKQPLKIITDIISTKMKLDSGRVMLYNQNYTIPSDEAIFIVVNEEDSEVFATSTTTRLNEKGEYEEINDALIRCTVTIDVLSAGDEARERKHEVITALNSIYSQQMQEANHVRIANLPNGFLNTSSAEESQMLNRYTINFNMMYKKTVKDLVDYYDTFNTQIGTNK